MDYSVTDLLGTVVPIERFPLGVDNIANELKKIRERTGLRRFLIIGAGFNETMHLPFSDDVFPQVGRDISKIAKELEGTDIKLSWWCQPTIRYVSNFTLMEDAWGNKSIDHKNCPLDEEFIQDWLNKIHSVIERCNPEFVVIEDDFTTSWARGLKGSGGCFCKHHLKLFEKNYGKWLNSEEIWDAFVNRTQENEKIRKAFAYTQRESLVSLAKRVRAEIDKVNPNIRTLFCEPGGADIDGDIAEAVTRAFAGGTRPAIRQCGTVYSAETTPATIPAIISHAVWTTERLPRDIETFYEADTYPHNRFFASANQLTSMMAGVLMAGSSSFQYQCTQYLDNPFEDDGYATRYLELLPRFQKIRSFIFENDARLAGVKFVWSPKSKALMRGGAVNHDGDVGDQLLYWQSYFFSKMGIPYTMRQESECNVASLIGGMASSLSDDEIRQLLSKGLFLDAEAAEIVASRGFANEIGVSVERVDRIPACGETICDSISCGAFGKRMNAFFVYGAGEEGTSRRFVRLTPHKGTQVLSSYLDQKDNEIAPSFTYSENSLGGRVAIIPVALCKNRTSSIYNFRKQALFRQIFNRLAGDSGLPVVAKNAPSIWVMASLSNDGNQMLVMVNNLSGDPRNGVTLEFAKVWHSAKVGRLDGDGCELPLNISDGSIIIDKSLAIMEPEFLILRR